MGRDAEAELWRRLAAGARSAEEEIGTAKDKYVAAELEKQAAIR